MTPQSANGRESGGPALTVTGVCSEQFAFEPREHLLAAGDLRERFIARNLPELTSEPNSYVSLCVSSFVSTVSLIK